MANKSTREMRVKQNKMKIYDALCEKLKIFYIIALGVCAAMLLTLFCPWTQNYNFYAKVAEQSLNGWQYFAAGISGKYDTVGDLGDFFMIYATSYTQVLAILTLISVILIIAIVALQIVTLVTKKHILSFASIAVEVLLFIFLIASCVVAFSMNNSDIYVKFCDPAQCEMHSYILIPIIISVALLAVNIVAVVKYFSARKYLN